MLFSSVSFLYLFLPTVLLFYFVAPRKAKNAVLLVSSLAFYFLGEPIYILLLIFSSVSDYLHSLFIEKYRGTKKARNILISSIIINLAMLGFFKYTDFFIGIINSSFGISIPTLNIPLPIGISFFTFQTMSYTIDVYRQNTPAEKNLLNMGTYVCLFPQLVAGPIVRYTDISNELKTREHTAENISIGIRRFAIGLGKKVLIANILGEGCSLFLNQTSQSAIMYWLYIAAYALQIYYDFSGYSDMAIGIGRMFGFKFPENFNYPFISETISEFWRRWHMTLGGWFRDYVYIPLGGNRVSKIKYIRNLAVVWILTGMWHGASINFVIWGAFFAVMLIFEKIVAGNLINRLPSFVKRIYTIFFILISFAIFSGDNLAVLSSTLKGMFFFKTPFSFTSENIYILKSFAPIFITAIIGATPVPRMLALKFSKSKASAIYSFAEPAFIALLIIISTASLINSSFNPFLYFRF